MAGSLIKYARKSGLDIPNLGDKPPKGRGIDRRSSCAPACAKHFVDQDGALESDESLAILGKLALRHQAAYGAGPEQVRAAMALVAMSQAEGNVSAPLVSLTLSAASSQDLDRLESEARQLLSASQTETRRDDE